MEFKKILVFIFLSLILVGSGFCASGTTTPDKISFSGSKGSGFFSGTDYTLSKNPKGEWYIQETSMSNSETYSLSSIGNSESALNDLELNSGQLDQIRKFVTSVESGTITEDSFSKTFRESLGTKDIQIYSADKKVGSYHQESYGTGYFEPVTYQLSDGRKIEYLINDVVVETQTNSKGTTTTRTKKGIITQKTIVSGTTTTIVDYDNGKKLKETTSSKGTTTTTRFEGETISRIDVNNPDGTSTTTRYNPQGVVTSEVLIDESGAITTTTKESNGNIVKKVQKYGITVTETYNPQGNLISENSGGYSINYVTDGPGGTQYYEITDLGKSYYYNPKTGEYHTDSIDGPIVQVKPATAKLLTDFRENSGYSGAVGAQTSNSKVDNYVDLSKTSTEDLIKKTAINDQEETDSLRNEAITELKNRLTTLEKEYSTNNCDSNPETDKCLQIRNDMKPLKETLYPNADSQSGQSAHGGTNKYPITSGNTNGAKPGTSGGTTGTVDEPIKIEAETKYETLGSLDQVYSRLGILDRIPTPEETGETNFETISFTVWDEDDKSFVEYTYMPKNDAEFILISHSLKNAKYVDAKPTDTSAMESRIRELNTKPGEQKLAILNLMAETKTLDTTNLYAAYLGHLTTCEKTPESKECKDATDKIKNLQSFVNQKPEYKIDLINVGCNEHDSEQCELVRDSLIAENCKDALVSTLCEMFSFESEYMLKEVQMNQIISREAQAKSESVEDGTWETSDSFKDDYNNLIGKTLIEEIDGLNYHNIDDKYTWEKEGTDELGHGTLEDYVYHLKDELSTCTPQPDCQHNVRQKLAAAEPALERSQVSVNIGYSIMNAIKNPDQNALKAAKVFGFEANYENLPVMLRESLPSQMCLDKIEGYLDKEVESNGGVTKYGCDSYDVNKDPDNHCVEVQGDLRAQRSAITPDNKTLVTYSYYVKTPQDPFEVSVKYVQNGNWKVFILENSSSSKNMDSVEIPLNDTTGIEDNSFTINLNTGDLSLTYPIILISAGTLKATIENNGNSQGNGGALINANINGN